MQNAAFPGIPIGTVTASFDPPMPPEDAETSPLFQANAAPHGESLAIRIRSMSARLPILSSENCFIRGEKPMGML
jgi:hypothetical protein